MRSAKKATILENFRRAETVHSPPLGGYIKRKSVKSYDPTLFFGALAGTRIPGPLIKSATRASIIHLGFLDLSQFNDVSTHDIQLFVLHQKADFAPVATSVQL